MRSLGARRLHPSAGEGQGRAAGLSGQVKVYSQLKEITWGKVAPTAEVIATLATDTSGASIYVYRKGSRLFDGSLATGLRIGFFLEDDNVTGTPNLMTADGLTLFDRAVAFGLANGATGIRSDLALGSKGAAAVSSPAVNALGKRLDACVKCGASKPGREFRRGKSLQPG